MTVRCAQCGEELLGAVNRCWRCGTTLLSRAGDARLPPVRRTPQPELAPVPPEADVIADFADRPTRPEGSAVVIRRVGSPFATPPPSASEPPVRQVPDVNQPGAPYLAFRKTYRARYPLANGGAIAGFVLGLASVLACSVTAVSIIPALVGLSLGVWGLYSARRGTAIVAVLLCCLALAVGGYRSAVAWYEWQHGYKPWDSPPPGLSP